MSMIPEHAQQATKEKPSDQYGSSWKRFQPYESPLVPVLTLNAEGTIQYVSPAARRLLEYRSNQAFDRCFFAHVHGRNLYRVMQDIAHMVCCRQQQASWLLRLQTGTGRYRWYKASVRNGLHDPATGIMVLLEAL